MSRRHGFTLIELLMVVAIIGIVSALLLPVLAQARGKARQTNCTSNFKQESLGILMYLRDYDDGMPLTYFGQGYESPPGNVYGQLLQPYLNNVAIFNCPGDPYDDAERRQDLPPELTEQQSVFNRAIKSDFAFNNEYLSPMLTSDFISLVSTPISEAQIPSPAQTILGADSIWFRDANGNPVGGGNAFVDPPCRYYSDGSDSFNIQNQHQSIWSYTLGWTASLPLSWSVYGGVWNWHFSMVTVAYCDGHVKAVTVKQLSEGCVVKDFWGGAITDSRVYPWWPDGH